MTDASKMLSIIVTTVLIFTIMYWIELFLLALIGYLTADYSEKRYYLMGIFASFVSIIINGVAIHAILKLNFVNIVISWILFTIMLISFSTIFGLYTGFAMGWIVPSIFLILITVTITFESFSNKSKSHSDTEISDTSSSNSAKQPTDII